MVYAISKARKNKIFREKRKNKATYFQAFVKIHH